MKPTSHCPEKKKGGLIHDQIPADVRIGARGEPAGEPADHLHAFKDA
jgi:hypothetical protein